MVESKKKVVTASTVRLAAPGTQGSNLYNAYQVLAQIAALYVKAQANERDGVRASTWTALSDSALSDLGTLVNLWQAQSREKSPAVLQTLIAIDRPEITTRIDRLCRRIEAIEKHCSLWTPATTYMRVILLCEKHFTRLLKAFVKISPPIAMALDPVQKGCARRSEVIRDLFAATMTAIQAQNSAYQPPPDAVTEEKLDNYEEVS